MLKNYGSMSGVLESGPDKWFLPFLDRVGRGENISI
jgi:hypothetical protein